MNASASPFVPTVEHEPEDPFEGQKFGAENIQEEGTDGLSGNPLWRPRYQGRIRSFNDQKGFGFIDCQETLRAFKRDVFIHRFQMAEAGCWVGQDVVFEVEVKKTGFPQARNVQPLNMGEATANWDYNAAAVPAAIVGGAYTGGCPGSRGGYGMQNYNYRESQGGAGGMGGRGAGPGEDTNANSEPIEEMLRKCSGSSDMWELIEQYGHQFGKKHVVTALYQLGLCRQYERRNMHVSLTSALVDRLVRCPARDITAEEATKVLWALAILEEVRENANAHRLAIDLGEEAAKRYHEFSPAQMASFVNSLWRLVRSGEEDELVAKITTNFSDYALGGGTLPRFPPEEIRTWTSFLHEVTSPNTYPSQAPAAPYPYGGMPGGKGGGMPYGQQYNAGMAGGMQPPWPGGGPGGKGAYGGMGGPGGKGPHAGMGAQMAGKGGPPGGCGGWGGQQGMGYPPQGKGGGGGSKGMALDVLGGPNGYPQGGGGYKGGYWQQQQQQQQQYGGYGGGGCQGGAGQGRSYGSPGAGRGGARVGSPGYRGGANAGPRTRSPGGGGGSGGKGGFKSMAPRPGSGSPSQRFAVQSQMSQDRRYNTSNGPGPRTPGLQEGGKQHGGKGGQQANGGEKGAGAASGTGPPAVNVPTPPAPPVHNTAPPVPPTPPAKPAPPPAASTPIPEMAGPQEPAVASPPIPEIAAQQSAAPPAPTVPVPPPPQVGGVAAGAGEATAPLPMPEMAPPPMPEVAAAAAPPPIPEMSPPPPPTPEVAPPPIPEMAAQSAPASGTPPPSQAGGGGAAAGGEADAAS